MIIGFVGFISCGKSATSSFLTSDFGFKAFAFADALKDTVAAMFCWPRDMVEGDTYESRQWRERIDPWWAERLGIPDFTPRWALQNVGSLMRTHFHKDLWLLNVEKRVAALGENANVVITDARHTNEIALIRKLGGKIVRVKRGPDPEWYEVAEMANIYGSDNARFRMLNEFHIHESEWSWIGEPVDVVIENNGSLDDLRAATKALL